MKYLIALMLVSSMAFCDVVMTDDGTQIIVGDGSSWGTVINEI